MEALVESSLASAGRLWRAAKRANGIICEQDTGEKTCFERYFLQYSSVW